MSGQPMMQKIVGKRTVGGVQYTTVDGALRTHAQHIQQEQLSFD
jgi:hypothetical protein